MNTASSPAIERVLRSELRFGCNHIRRCAGGFDSVNRSQLKAIPDGPSGARTTSKHPMTARIDRPLSPHMQTYRWTLTMMLSIVHRATGIALYFGTFLLAWWLTAVACGPTAYAHVQAFTGSFIGPLMA